MFLWELDEVIREFFPREETSLSKNDIGQMIYFNLTKAYSEKLRILEKINFIVRGVDYPSP